jgi:transcriptional regulator PpsR
MTKRPYEQTASSPGRDAALSALSHLAPELASTFAAVASDIALVIGADGVISNVAVAGDGSPLPMGVDWVGRRWTDTVTRDTRDKIEQLLDETNLRGVSQRREVTLLSANGCDIPIAFTAIRLGTHGPLLAVGRDLRAIAAIQQRFIESQQEMERDYWKRRQAEARYRLLFQVATDAVLVVDALTHDVLEANRAAGRLFASAPSALAGRKASAGFAPLARQAVHDLITTVQGRGQPGEILVRSGGDGLRVSAVPFQADGVPLMLLRVRAVDSGDETDAGLSRLVELVERTPDAIAVTDAGGHIRLVNPAFLVLCGLPADADLGGRALSEWVGIGSRDVTELLDVVRRQGMVAPVVTRLRSMAGSAEIEIAAVLLPEADQDSIGFTLRARVRRTAAEEVVFGDLARAVERLATRLGTHRLPGLMREGTDLIERHLLQAALARASEDAAAAQLLGISEESLRLRLQRHGLRPGGEPTIVGSR